MKIKITLITFCFIIVTGFSYAQKKDSQQSIINSKVQIKKYHQISELENISKGELLNLYTERIQALTNVIPYIALATKPGATMSTLGIPNTSENVKVLEKQIENTDDYIKNTLEFQKVILPYSDTKNLMRAIIFYEEIMKSLNTYDDLY
ncbi:hypothetical protein ACFSKN_02640 [Mariniflexile gromovii]|uniref:Uncharacterized protein n=1 Tax=Mariniflexile gromovii TaxID=362523 RepID=A0ABS4BQX3_9FLAO|nr:hypothetical protein [Mariniflexile gromovii]MBP0902502.1 hypothetical protein [Mariniflexile gromovii]